MINLLPLLATLLCALPDPEVHLALEYVDGENRTAVLWVVAEVDGDNPTGAWNFRGAGESLLEGTSELLGDRFGLRVPLPVALQASVVDDSIQASAASGSALRNRL